jgi:hypothetical protein
MGKLYKKNNCIAKALINKITHVNAPVPRINFRTYNDAFSYAAGQA